MTRGVAWDAFELQVAAKAYKIATSNRISGADQTARSFGDSIVRNVRELQPTDLLDNDLRYSNRINASECILRNLKKNVFVDINKFARRLLSVENKKPTGNVSEKDKHCMAIATHLGMCTGMNYDYTTFGVKCFDPVVTWKNYLAFLELRFLPKFDVCPQKSVVDKQDAKVMAIEEGTKGKKRDTTTDDTFDTLADNFNHLDSQDEEVIEIKEENDVPYTDYNAPALTVSMSNSNNNAKGTKGIKKSKLELKQQNNVEAGLKVMKFVGSDITKIMNNVETIRDVLTKKLQRKNETEIITLLERKYKLLKDTRPVEAAAILTKINRKYEHRLQELESNENSIQQPGESSIYASSTSSISYLDQNTPTMNSVNTTIEES
jgi:hypothetical protein